MTDEKSANKKSSGKGFNIILIVILVLLIIPQTRQPIQVGLHRVLGLFGPSFKSVEKAQTISDYNWTLQSESGELFNFNDAKEKVIVINFWATWCPPCIAEMPSLEKLYQAYQDEVVFLFVSNEDLDKLQNFKEKHNYQFPVYKAATKPPSEFDINSIPRTFVIDKNGKIVVDKTGAANWFSDGFKEKLELLLKE
jgi:thiol-disulfide isomerase/thioredoxin